MNKLGYTSFYSEGILRAFFCVSASFFCPEPSSNCCVAFARHGISVSQKPLSNCCILSESSSFHYITQYSANFVWNWEVFWSLMCTSCIKCKLKEWTYMKYLKRCHSFLGDVFASLPRSYRSVLCTSSNGYFINLDVLGNIASNLYDQLWPCECERHRCPSNFIH